MALTRKEKIAVLEKYKQNIESAKNLIALKQYGIPVNEINKLRTSLIEPSGKMMIVKKRIFLNLLKESGYEGGDLKDLEGSVIVLQSYEDEFAPLKVIANFKKDWKKGKKQFTIEYLGGWFDKNWKDAAFVTQMADLPSKEELLSKLAYMLNYPLQSFAQSLNQIAEKQGGGESEDKAKEEVEVKVEEKKEDTVKEEKSEEKVEEKKEEVEKEENTEEKVSDVEKQPKDKVEDGKVEEKKEEAVKEEAKADEKQPEDKDDNKEQEPDDKEKN